MAVEVASAYVGLLPSAKGFQRNIEKEIGGDLDRSGRSGGRTFGTAFVRTSAGPIKASIGGIGKLFAGVFAGTVAFNFFKSAVDGASDLAESTSKVGVVFGRNSKIVTDFARSSARSLGLSTQAALEAAGTLGNLFVALKLPQAEAAKMSTRMVALAGDLASFNNTRPEDALEALRAGLTGEAEPLKRYGVNLNDATIRAQAFKLGLIKTVKGALTPAAKAQAAYSLILDQTTTAQGDFARTSGGLANRQRILAAQWSDMKAKIGQQLLPAMVALAGFATNKLLPALSVIGRALKAGFGGDTSKLTGVQKVIGSIGLAVRTLVLGFKGLILAFRDGDVSSDGFVGVMERLGVVARTVSDWFFRDALPAIRAFGSYIKDTVIPVVVKIARDALPGLRSGVSDVSTALKDNKPQIMQVMAFLGQLFAMWKSFTGFLITEVLPLLGPILKAVFQSVGTILGITIGSVSKLWQAFTTLSSLSRAALREVVTAFLSFVGTMLTGAEKAFGWIPGVGPKLRSAKKDFDTFANGIKEVLSRPLSWELRLTGTQRVLATLNEMNRVVAAGGGTHINAGLFAKGGRPPVGMPAIVGEEGPELWIPDRPGTIVPNDEIGSGASLAGMTVIVNNPLPEPASESVPKVLRRRQWSLGMAGAR